MRLSLAVKVVTFAFLLGTVVVGIPTVTSSIATEPVSAFDVFQENVLAQFRKDPGLRAIHTTYGPAGVVERVVAVDEALAIARLVMHDAPPQTENTQATHGFGIGGADPSVRAALDWPFCDAASHWAQYVVTNAPPGSAFAVVDAGVATPQEVAGEFCGGVVGPAYDWDDITLDTWSISGLKLHCGVAQVLVDYAGVAFDRGLLGGVLCGQEVTSARGKGAVGTLQIGIDVADYFLGSVALVKMGDEVT